MVYTYLYTKEQYEEALRLRVEGFNYRQISRKLGITYDTIRGWLSRGNKPLAAWTDEDWNRKISNNMKTRKQWSDIKRATFLASCATSKIGEQNPQWKGNDTSPSIAAMRTRRLYEQVTDLLEQITEVKWECHHIDGNDYNNISDNIAITTRKGHMTIDGRLATVTELCKGGKLKRS